MQSGFYASFTHEMAILVNVQDLGCFQIQKENFVTIQYWHMLFTNFIIGRLFPFLLNVKKSFGKYRQRRRFEPNFLMKITKENHAI